MPNLILGAEVHRLVPKLFRAEVTRAEHRLPLSKEGQVSVYFILQSLMEMWIDVIHSLFPTKKAPPVEYTY